MTPAEYDTLLQELRAIRRGQRVTMLAVCGIILWLAGLTFASDVTIALKDRARFPATEHPYLYYFGTGHVAPEQQDQLARVLAFTVCSCTRAEVIEHQLPVQVAPTVFRVDTRALGWIHSLPQLLKTKYPYSTIPGSSSLLIRADWFIATVLDQAESQETYLQLLYGSAPKTLAELLKLLEATPGSRYQHGHIESASGVSVAGTRLITTQPTAGRHDVWITFDSSEIAGESDPLEKLDRSQKFEASEIIAMVPKSVASTGELGGLQVYALANAAGQLQQKAPANVVVDHHGTRGVEIRNCVSCIICHEEGLRPLKVNALRQYITSGAEAYADYKTQQEIERFHLTRVETLIDRQNEDYATILWAINQLTPAQNAQAMQAVIRAYDAGITLEKAARDTWSTPKELQLALANYGRLPSRLAQLAHGQTINRDSWELYGYRISLLSLKAWRTK